MAADDDDTSASDATAITAGEHEVWMRLVADDGAAGDQQRWVGGAKTDRKATLAPAPDEFATAPAAADAHTLLLVTASERFEVRSG